jgi:hypothetical protein
MVALEASARSVRDIDGVENRTSVVEEYVVTR